MVLQRKEIRWKKDQRVIFNDMGNWGVGVIDQEGERSDLSRWYWIQVEQCANDIHEKDRRLVRSDDLCVFDERKWEIVRSSLLRLAEIQQEKRQLTERIREAFEADWTEED